MRIVLALKVRNEADIIEANLRHHMAAGVDFFIVTDNDSDDGTREILAGYEGAGLMHVIDERDENFWSQAHGWVTRMAQLAGGRFEADWVLHADADEFWLPAAGSLRAALAGIDPRFAVVLAPRPEFVPRPEGPEPFCERMTVRERYSRLRPKVAHRGLRGLELHQGAHDVSFSEAAEAEVLRESRAVTRFPGAINRAGEGSLTWAPSWPVRVMHFPIRSFEQYKRRIETVVFRGDPPNSETRKRLRRQYNHDRLGRGYEKQISSAEEIAAGIEAGRLVVDERLRDSVRQSPDPLAGSAGEAPARTVGDAEREQELAEAEYDAMQSLARSQRMLIRRLDRAQERANQPKARVGRAAGTRAGRLLLRLKRAR